jgi:glutaredoxin
MLIVISTTLTTQAQNRKVLYEIFTNSHCSFCGGAYSYFDENIANNEASNDLITIAYHLSTYSDDKLYQETKTESVPRANYYGGITGTPTIFINGQRQSSYQNWLPNINNFRNSQSNNFPVTLNVRLVGNVLEIETGVNSSIDISNLNLNIVVVEDVDYQGRNGVKLHKNVMRTMPTGASGQQINLIANQELKITKSVTLNQIWNLEKISVVAYVQNSQTKEVYNVSSIDKKDFQLTSNVEDQKDNDKLYPNPTNGITEYSFDSKYTGICKIKLIDNSGKLLLENSYTISAGQNKIIIDTKDLNLPNGSYTFIIDNNGIESTKQIIILK